MLNCKDSDPTTAISVLNANNLISLIGFKEYFYHLHLINMYIVTAYS
jgi:hypothetical protein